MKQGGPGAVQQRKKKWASRPDVRVTGHLRKVSGRAREVPPLSSSDDPGQMSHEFTLGELSSEKSASASSLTHSQEMDSVNIPRGTFGDQPKLPEPYHGSMLSADTGPSWFIPADLWLVTVCPTRHSFIVR